MAERRGSADRLHAMDVTSLVLGLVAVGAAAVLLTAHAYDWSFSLRWLLPALLLGLGVLGLVVALRPRRDVEPSDAGPPETAS